MRWTLWVFLLANVGCNGQFVLTVSAPDNYRFVVANDELFAVRHGGSYGTELGVLFTVDEGDTWKEIDVPRKTISLSGRDGDLIALTSNAELFTRGGDGANWKLFWSDSGRRYTYDLSCAPTGEIYLASVVEDATAGARTPAGDAHKFAVANFHYIASAVVTTQQAVARLEAAFGKSDAK